MMIKKKKVLRNFMCLMIKMIKKNHFNRFCMERLVQVNPLQ